MAINYDSGGFIIGERRAKEIADGVNQTNDTTKQILDFLKNTMTELKATAEERATANQSDLNRQNRHGRSVDASSREAGAIRQVVDASESLARATERVRSTTQGLGTESSGRSGGVSGTRERSEQARERDSKGRFIGARGAKETSSHFDFSGKAKDFMSGNGGVDVSGVDPTIDALREVKDIVSPVGRVFGGMGARAIGLFRGRLKKRRGDELLPKEQVDANKEQQRNDKQRNKLLKRLIDAVRSNSGGGGLGGLLGSRGALGLLGGLGKAGLKRIPLLGALFGGASLAKDWDKLDTAGKGKGIGEVIGTTVGGVLGAFLGPVGAIGGAGLGNYLGGIFGNKVGKWVDELRTADLPTMFKELVKGVLKTNPVTGIPYRLGEKAYSAGQSIRDWFGGGDSSSSGGDIGVASGDIGASSGRFSPLLDTIARAESKRGAFGTSGYDAIHSGARIKPNKPISQMTLAEVKAYQKKLVDSGHSSSAVGRYQFIKNSEAFSNMAAQAGLKDTDLFDAKAQDKLAIHYAGGEKQLNEWIRTGNKEALTRKTAQQWAGMKNINGRGNYDGDGLNKAHGGGIEEMGRVINEINANQYFPKKPLNAAKAKAKEVPLFQRPANSGMAPIQVPKVTAELSKIGRNTTAQAKSSAPTDVGIGQTVSDRGLAHIISGGIGYDRYS
jgi:muramidase (phage lysozyme)